MSSARSLTTPVADKCSAQTRQRTPKRDNYPRMPAWGNPPYDRWWDCTLPPNPRGRWHFRGLCGRHGRVSLLFVLCLRLPTLVDSAMSQNDIPTDYIFGKDVSNNSTGLRTYPYSTSE